MSRLWCQVLGCDSDLSTEKRSYCITKRICSTHLQAEALTLPGHGEHLFRFCFQCGKLEPLSAFDGPKRSCRFKLSQRRAARQAVKACSMEGYAPSAAALATHALSPPAKRASSMQQQHNERRSCGPAAMLQSAVSAPAKGGPFGDPTLGGSSPTPGTTTTAAAAAAAFSMQLHSGGHAAGAASPSGGAFPWALPAGAVWQQDPTPHTAAAWQQQAPHAAAAAAMPLPAPAAAAAMQLPHHGGRAPLHHGAAWHPAPPDCSHEASASSTAAAALHAAASRPAAATVPAGVGASDVAMMGGPAAPAAAPQPADGGAEAAAAPGASDEPGAEAAVCFDALLHLLLEEDEHFDLPALLSCVEEGHGTSSSAASCNDVLHEAWRRSGDGACVAPCTAAAAPPPPAAAAAAAAAADQADAGASAANGGAGGGSLLLQQLRCPSPHMAAAHMHMLLSPSSYAAEPLPHGRGKTALQAYLHPSHERLGAQ